MPILISSVRNLVFLTLMVVYCLGEKFLMYQLFESQVVLDHSFHVDSPEVRDPPVILQVQDLFLTMIPGS